MTEPLAKAYRLNNPPCIAESVDNDVVIIDLDTGTYHSIKGFSGVIWNALTQSGPASTLVDAIDDQSKKTAFSAALAQFIEQLLERELVAVSPKIKTETLDSIHLPEDFSLQVDSFTDMQELLSLDPIHDADDEMGWPKEKALAE